MSKEKEYPKGFYYKEPHENAPDFVKGSCSIKVKDFIDYLQSINDEFLNLDFKISKEQKPYAEVNTWKPEKKETKNELETDTNDIPF